MDLLSLKTSKGFVDGFVSYVLDYSTGDSAYGLQMVSSMSFLDEDDCITEGVFGYVLPILNAVGLADSEFVLINKKILATVDLVDS